MREGDIIGTDCVVEKDGFMGDSCYTFAEGEMDSATAEEVRLYSGGKDIARMTLPDGGTLYKVGPYTDKDKAEQLVTFVRDMGVAEAVCKVLGEASAST